MSVIDDAYPVAPLGCRLGEGPLWHSGEGALYSVDIEGKSIWRLDPGKGVAREFPLGFMVGCLGIRSEGGFILAGENGFTTWDPTSGLVNELAHPEPDRHNARFNDGAVDPAGRFWAGTMTPEGFENSLYRLDPDHRVQRMERGIGISNGIGWSPDRQTMYFTDSPRKLIYAYDYIADSGAIENRRVWLDTSDDPGVPDGLCVDREGCVWSARWDGWRITRYDPQGQQMLELRLPVQRPTSCAFGGADLQTLFITSAWSGLTQDERRSQPLAGAIFKAECQVTGLAPNLFLG